MKAAILEKLNAPLVVGDVGLPGLDVGQVLVRVYSSGICGAQIGEITGAKGEDPYLPHLLGHEGGGVVEDIGPGVTHVKPGDHVVMHWRKGVGIESGFPKYARGDGFVGGGLITTFNEYAVVSENRLTPIGDDIPFEIAALMGCAVTTGLGVVFNDAQLKPGQSITVLGCGGVGLNVIQGAAMIGAYPIFAIDIHEEKLKMAHHFGATHMINMDKMSSRSEQLFDAVIETTGHSGMIGNAYSLTVPGGRVILVGQPHYEDTLILYGIRKHFRGLTVMDSQGGQTNPTEDIPRYLNLCRIGKLKLDSLITHRYPLNKVNEAIEVVKSGRAGRVILEMK